MVSKDAPEDTLVLTEASPNALDEQIVDIDVSDLPTGVYASILYPTNVLETVRIYICIYNLKRLVMNN